MRILYITSIEPVPLNWGPRYVTYGLLGYLVRHHDVDLVFLADREASEAANAVRLAVPAVKRVRAFKKPGRIRTLWGRMRWLAGPGLPAAFARHDCGEMGSYLEEQLTREKYDLVHMDTVNTIPLKKYVNGPPVVLMVHDAYSLSYIRARREARRIVDKIKLEVVARAFIRCEQREYPKYHKVLTVSPADTLYLRREVKNCSIETVPIPLSEEFSQSKGYTGWAEREITRILCAGHMDTRWAGEGIVDFIANAFPAIHRQVVGARLTIIGRNPVHDVTRAIEKAGNCVEHLDYVDEYRRFLEQDWIYVYPQRCGAGMQVKIQQAMAVGLPVVGSAMLMEAYGGTNGQEYYASADRASFVESILYLSENCGARRQMGRLAYEFVRDKFSLDAVGQKLESVYGSLLV